MKSIAISSLQVHTVGPNSAAVVERSDQINASEILAEKLSQEFGNQIKRR